MTKRIGLLEIVFTASLVACSAATKGAIEEGVADAGHDVSDARANLETDAAPAVDAGLRALDSSVLDSSVPDSSVPEWDPRMHLVVIDREAYPLAMCNDGTEAVMYVRRGTPENVSKWVLWFEAGGGCRNAESCAERIMDEPEKMTSRIAQAEPERNMGGILSSNAEVNPDFSQWNAVWLYYCSSDAWTGERASAALPELFPDGSRPGIFFRGAYNADAMIATLREGATGLPSLSGATELIVAGSSAGSVGLRTHLDAIASMFPSTRVVGLSDASLKPPLQEEHGLDTSVRDAVDQTEFEVHDSRVDVSCGSRHESDPWRCRDGFNMITEGHIETSMFCAMDQHDYKAVQSFGIQPSDPRYDRLRTLLARRIRETVTEFCPGGFSPRSGFHVYAVTGFWDGVTVEGHNLQEVFGNWYFDRRGPKQVIRRP